MAIYFRGGNSPEITNIVELLEHGFLGHIEKESYQFKETYHDEELEETECNPARRSFSALVEICQTYFPETTEKDVAKVVIDFIRGGTSSFLCCGFCSTINKVVFCRQHSDYNLPNISSWGNSNPKSKIGDDGISFNYILELANN